MRGDDVAPLVAIVWRRVTSVLVEHRPKVRCVVIVATTVNRTGVNRVAGVRVRHRVGTVTDGHVVIITLGCFDTPAGHSSHQSHCADDCSCKGEDYLLHAFSFSFFSSPCKSLILTGRGRLFLFLTRLTKRNLILSCSRGMVALLLSFSSHILLSCRGASHVT